MIEGMHILLEIMSRFVIPILFEIIIFIIKTFYVYLNFCFLKKNDLVKFN